MMPKRIIESSAELYYSNNKNKLTNFKNGTCYISIDDLDLTDKEKQIHITTHIMVE